MNKRLKVSTIVFILGFAIFIYPFVSIIISHFNQTKALSNYKSDMKLQDEIKKQELKAAADEYNKRIANENPIVVDETLNENINNKIDFLETTEIIGNLTIPKIDVDLPLYDGVKEDNLKKGVVHLANTSYPTGEPDTHSVIAGHSGLTGVVILDNLDKIEIGDGFQIEYLDNVTNYEIIDIRAVEPDDTSSLSVEEGKTLVTLVTCTPKYINTHRLLVTGQKVDTLPVTEKITFWDKFKEYMKNYYMYFILLIAVIIFVVVNIILYKKEKKLEEENL